MRQPFVGFLDDNESPSILTYQNPRVFSDFSRPDEHTIIAYNWPHICQDLDLQPDKIKEDLLKSGIMDYGYFQRLIENKKIYLLALHKLKVWPRLMENFIKKERSTR